MEIRICKNCKGKGCEVCNNSGIVPKEPSTSKLGDMITIGLLVLVIGGGMLAIHTDINLWPTHSTIKK